MYPHAAPSFAAMTLETRYAAETSKGFFIYPGRTCGFAIEIVYLAATTWRLGELLIDSEEDRTLRAVLVGMLREGER